MYDQRLTATIMAALISGALAMPTAWAAEEAPVFEPVPEPPPLPEPVRSGETLEPDVTIIEGTKETVHEYRINGQLYAIKVVPKNAPPYYLVDIDGDGSFDTRRKELTADFLVPHWVLFTW